MVYSFVVMMYFIIDLQLQQANKALHLKDLKVMKVLHDLKNPVHALISTINDINLDAASMRNIANADLEDIADMLDNLKTEFKARYNMQSQEERREVNTIDFLENISRAHIRLATNGNNNFSTEIDHLVPEFICIPKLTVSRICHNLITNSLKHTTRGKVTVKFKMPSNDELNIELFNHEGAKYDLKLQ